MFTIFLLIFLAFIPVLLFYSKGYSLFNELGLQKTGGLSITNDRTGVEIYINGELARSPSIIQRSFFVRELLPGSYFIEAKKEDFTTWSKTLLIFPEIVTEVSSFMITNEIEIVPVPRSALEADILDIEREEAKRIKEATEKGEEIELPDSLVEDKEELEIELKRDVIEGVEEINPKFIKYTNLFLKPEKYGLLEVLPNLYEENIALDAGSRIISSGDLIVREVDGRLIVRWIGEEDQTPPYFCVNTQCKNTILIHDTVPAARFDFFPGRSDLLLVLREDGLYVTEIDDRSEQNKVRLYEGQNLDFRAFSGDTIVVKDGDAFFEVIL